MITKAYKELAEAAAQELSDFGGTATPAVSSRGLSGPPTGTDAGNVTSNPVITMVRARGNADSADLSQCKMQNAECKMGEGELDQSPICVEEGCSSVFYTLKTARQSFQSFAERLPEVSDASEETFRSILLVDAILENLAARMIHQNPTQTALQRAQANQP